MEAASAFSPLLFSSVASHYLLAAFVLAALGFLLIDTNATSLHSLYQKRLGDAFLFDPNNPAQADPELRDVKNIYPRLDEIDTDLCPYPIVNASLNLQGSPYANQRGRNADFFVFTPEYTGSHPTGYVGSAKISDKDPGLGLGLSAAMAISGAAISPNMGAATIFSLTFSLAFLNIRLGYWLYNPKYVVAPQQSFESLKALLSKASLYLLGKEMFSRIDESDGIIYLTDGGNLENLGLYELLRRRCKLIIAVDAEEDATLSFPSFLALQRYARIDFGAKIDLPWQLIAESPAPPQPAFRCAAGEIQYAGEETGILL
jgi:hypothetical protein